MVRLLGAALAGVVLAGCTGIAMGSGRPPDGGAPRDAGTASPDGGAADGGAADGGAADAGAADGGSNTPPVVSAGPDRSATVQLGASLDGTATDDGLPSGALTVSWSQVAGPAVATLATPDQQDTLVTFSAEGTYGFRLTASDGELTASDEVVVVVAPPASGGLEVVNGWLTIGGAAVFGWSYSSGHWRGGPPYPVIQRANITRHSVGDPGGDVRPNRTEDLDALTDVLLRDGVPGFEHCPGLWFDRRRDDHSTTCHTGAARSPYLEQPWERTGPGTACDGEPRYDLTRFNAWYFDRLKAFADRCDAKGCVLIDKHYNQHSFLELQTHYVDFPWSPGNALQNTGMPASIPAANAFYDVTNSGRVALHQAYIRHQLDVLAGNANVIHHIGREYTGPRSFVELWLDTVIAWEQSTGHHVLTCLAATRDVQNAIMADPARAPAVSVLDLRYWYYDAGGVLRGPGGGQQTPPRTLENGEDQRTTSPAQIVRKLREMRAAYPNVALIDALGTDRQQAWLFLMGGGSLLVADRTFYPGQVDPPTYVDFDLVGNVLPLSSFIQAHLRTELPHMLPVDVTGTTADTWALGNPGQSYLVYSLHGAPFDLDLQGASGTLLTQWVDPRTGTLSNAAGGSVGGGGLVHFTPPSTQDWALFVHR